MKVLFIRSLRTVSDKLLLPKYNLPFTLSLPFSVTPSLQSKYKIKNDHKKLKDEQEIIIDCSNKKSSNVMFTIPGFAERTVGRFPKSIQPYLRLMRMHTPTGSWLLLWPGYFGIALATPATQNPDPSLLALFAIGTILMRGVGCTINDIFDKDFDKHIERTKLRPLASGIISKKSALAFLVLESSLAFYILCLFDYKSILLGLGSVGLVVFYPLTKRFTHLCQVFLGLTFNWGALLGYSVVTKGNIDLVPALSLYIGCAFWTMIYDTIYAHQDKEDDLKFGLKSLALLLDEKTKPFLYFFAASMMSSLAISGITTYQTWPFYLSLAVVSSKLYLIISNLNIHDKQNCWEHFKECANLGWIIMIGIVVGNYIKNKKEVELNEPVKVEKD